MRTRATCQPRKPEAPVTSTGFMGFLGLSQGPCQHLQVVGQTGVDAQRGRGFEAAMYHAVLAPRVVAGAVTFPGRLGHQAFKCLVMTVRDQIARALPALHVIGGVTPGGTREVVFTPEKLKVERSLSHGVLDRKSVV